MRKNNFNLVEVIITVTVFVLLAIVMTAALKQSGKAAPERSCTYNLKKIGAALNSFYSKNNRFPAGEEWMKELQPEIIHFQDYLVCPLDDTPAAATGTGILSSYALNDRLTAEKGWPENADPDTFILVADAAPGCVLFNQDTLEGLSTRHPQPGEPDTVKVNVLLLNGQVKSVVLKKSVVK